MEDLKWLAAKLPETVGGELQSYIMESVYDEHELGHGLMLFHRESITVGPPLQQTMTPQDRENYVRRLRNKWGARCTCSTCGEEFLTGYAAGGRRENAGIILYQGEDGLTYPYVDDGEALMTERYEEGDGVMCPFCGYEGELVRRSELRKGRTWQVVQAEVQVVEGYMAVLFWMVTRHVDDAGCDGVGIRPRDALVIDRDGRLRRFTHVTHGQFGDSWLEGWRECSTIRDPMQIQYYSYDAAKKRQVGGWVFIPVPDLTGSTGEKTALEIYVKRGGVWPGVYLQTWAKHRSVENLMRGGFEACVMREINDKVEQAIMYSHRCERVGLSWADLREVKPYRMLHMSRESWRAVRGRAWTLHWMHAWELYREEYRTDDAAEFDANARKLGGPKEIEDLLEMTRSGWSGFEVPRVVRYLEKQNLLDGGVRMLIDYRKMRHYADLEEAAETLWPRSLLAAHDRMVENLAAHGTTLTQQNFAAARVLYRDLEWTDGELRIVLPKSELELKEEGQILRHCVGSYGHSHVNGEPIFFVRKYRRPERSYYTLNINMKGTLPKEIQLHGYGNEHHGEHKQYRHSIPKKVRDFVDRWEREVLTPWFYEQKRREAAEKKGKKATPQSA